MVLYKAAACACRCIKSPSYGFILFGYQEGSQSMKEFFTIKSIKNYNHADKSRLINFASDLTSFAKKLFKWFDKVTLISSLLPVLIFQFENLSITECLSFLAG